MHTCEVYQGCVHNYPQEKIKYNLPDIDNGIVTSSFRNRFIDTWQIVFVMNRKFTPHWDIAWETDASLWKSERVRLPENVRPIYIWYT